MDLVVLAAALAAFLACRAGCLTVWLRLSCSDRSYSPSPSPPQYPRHRRGWCHPASCQPHSIRLNKVGERGLLDPGCITITISWLKLGMRQKRHGFQISTPPTRSTNLANNPYYPRQPPTLNVTPRATSCEGISPLRENQAPPRFWHRRGSLPTVPYYTTRCVDDSRNVFFFIFCREEIYGCIVTSGAEEEFLGLMELSKFDMWVKWDLLGIKKDQKYFLC